MSWDAEAVLAASDAWAWVPEDAPHVRTDELLVVAYPDYFPSPTGARVFGSDRDAAALVDEIHEIARGFGRDRLWWNVSDTTRPATLEAEIIRRGGQVVERMDVLALPIADGVPDLGVPDLGVPDLPAPGLPAPGLGAPGPIEVRRVRDMATKRDAHLVERDAFGGDELSDEQLEQGVADLAPGFDDDSTGQVVAYLDGRPAGVGGWTMAGPVCGLWGGATHSQLRGRGAYRAVLAERLRIGRAAGATLGLTHGRVATSAPILRRIGFTRYGEQRQLVVDL